MKKIKNGTSTLNRHKNQCIIYKNNNLNNYITNKNLKLIKSDRNILNENLLYFIIDSGLPFKIDDSSYF